MKFETFGLNVARYRIKSNLIRGHKILKILCPFYVEFWRVKFSKLFIRNIKINKFI